MKYTSKTPSANKNNDARYPLHLLVGGPKVSMVAVAVAKVADPEGGHGGIWRGSLTRIIVWGDSPV